MTSHNTTASRSLTTNAALSQLPWLVAAIGIAAGAAGYLLVGAVLAIIGVGAGIAVFRWRSRQTAGVELPQSTVARPKPIEREPDPEPVQQPEPTTFLESLAERLVEIASPSAESESPAEAPLERTETPADVNSLVELMLGQGRYALLLRPQIAGSLTDTQRERAQEGLMNSMAIVPAGEVALGQLDAALDDGHLTNEELLDPYVNVIQVDGFYLDRYPVTNRQFQQFVQAGGYEQMAFWEPEVWPAVLDFVDRTGHPGPRIWRNGRFERGTDDHPVVGICWYEAAAYARWCGKRLATDAEWVKAGSWPVNLPNEGRMQRKYPWGNVMDRRMANLWGSGPGRTTPVTDYNDGVSVGGIYQLIGNVWEWTFDDYEFATAERTGSEPWSSGRLKSLRGGAFDTYFDSQATCHFQSADMPLSRKHNVGFRCALGLCDLAPVGEEPIDEEAIESDAVATEESV